MLKKIFDKISNAQVEYINGAIEKDDNEVKAKKFKSIMEFANEIIKEVEKSEVYYSEDYCKEKIDKNHPLLDVIRLLGKKVQSEYLIHLLYGHGEELPRIDTSTLLFDQFEKVTNFNESLYDLKCRVDVEKRVKLGRDLILPWPWERGRLINAISHIGEGRTYGIWEEDFNHNIELWLPLGITWVHKGNHSIASGIIQCSGVIKPRYIYDISKIYKYVYSDGVNFYRKEDDSKITSVENVELAAIFEIGRIMVEKSISY